MMGRRAVLRSRLSAARARVSGLVVSAGLVGLVGLTSVMALPGCARSDPAAALAPAPGGSTPFSFALIGDLPYFVLDEPNLGLLFDAIGREDSAFIVHVGDVKSSMELCSDALYARRKALLQQSPRPLILVPGDNDWTDCHRSSSGGFDPRERLAAVRSIFFADPGPLGQSSQSTQASHAGPASHQDPQGRLTARGQPLRLERQPQAPENVRWRIGAVQFLTVHVVGSNNGLDKYPGSRGEFSVRDGLNRAWVSSTLEAARRDRVDALVIAIHGAPDFDPDSRSGFKGFIEQLRELSTAFSQPILLLHGDHHEFKVDQPLRDPAGRSIRHLTRVQSFGAPRSQSWVQIRYEPTHPMRFTITPRDIEAVRQ